MIDLSVKLDEQFAASRNPLEAANRNRWKSLAGNLNRSQLVNKLQYVMRYLIRARCRGLKIESFYITDTEQRISNHRKRIKFKYEILEELKKHNSNLSYGVFSSFYECSKYKMGSFYVLRFKKHHDLFRSIVTKMSNEFEFNVWIFDYNHNPYIIFDAYENGIEYFFSEAAKQTANTQVKTLFHLDYFTNAPWCSVDLESETIADIVRLKGSIEVEIHQKMMKPRRDKESSFWKHVFRMARKYFSKK